MTERDQNTYVAESALRTAARPVGGRYVQLDGTTFYQISNVDSMAPFLMSLVSDSDHWMFISSNGALTAGRRNPDSALFPYYTDDRIHDSVGRTGGKTVLLVNRAGRRLLWEPFSGSKTDLYRIQRNLYKNVLGNRLVFEEVNDDLQLVFRFAWMTSDRFGFVRKAFLSNSGSGAVQVEILDGIQNILPYGITRRFQLEYSTLADGYKKNELDMETGLAIFRLSSIPTDKAEPSEALRATTVWSVGLEGGHILLSTRQLDRFRHGLAVETERDVRAVRGAYLVHGCLEMNSADSRSWYQVAEVNQDKGDVYDLKAHLENRQELLTRLEEDIARGTENLEQIVAAGDGLQLTEDRLNSNRHLANVLFNEMRGGVFDDGYWIDTQDFRDFVGRANQVVAGRHQEVLDELPETILHQDLLQRVASTGDALLERLGHEYLPLTFSRRHGDPSRPWNMFSIEVRDASGKKILNYQGNWRDIFQNWEALSLSFPGYVESMIFRFVNASTPDGYNPYRLVREGFEWESLDPGDPWSYIGYWGDHQIVYLLKLLEVSVRFHPGKLQDFLSRDIFTYADVPYRIRPYEKLLEDPHNTIDFDVEWDREVGRRVAAIGNDGKLVCGPDGEILLVNLAEKILVTVLSKLSNFIPEAGIWMNTQRPEWNDANNALVGFGVSMVTLYHLRRFMALIQKLLADLPEDGLLISTEVGEMLDRVFEGLEGFAHLLDAPLPDADRKKVLDALGSAGSDYRQMIYQAGFSGSRRSVTATRLTAFCEVALRFLDHSIRAGRRADGLYHAYNLMEVKGSDLRVQHLYEMLEGQVAVLSSGCLSAEESLEVLDQLRNSALYREDQNSYLLYPDRQLPRFLDKNDVPEEAVRRSLLLTQLLEDGNREIVLRDATGKCHFNGSLRNARLLREALRSLEAEGYAALLEREAEQILDLYEQLFRHRFFTGRSGTFYKYEGLGSIYWHMVSKLLLAVQEVWIDAVRKGVEDTALRRLRAHYFEIREGIGVHKSPELYGAFPTDPYSHTPGFAGVQQPGLTGQVKEDIITRFAELGLQVEKGRIVFCPGRVDPSEFLSKAGQFNYRDVAGAARNLSLEQGSLGFTYCQVPVIVSRADQDRIRVVRSDGTETACCGLALDEAVSRSIFERSAEVARLEIFFAGPVDA